MEEEKKLWCTYYNRYTLFGVGINPVGEEPAHDCGTWFNKDLTAYTWAESWEEAKKNFERIFWFYNIPETGCWSEKMNPCWKKTRIR